MAGRFVAVIELHEVSKHYGRMMAVDNLSFRVTGFLGPNGVGKSTTMRLIMGLHRLDAGDITVNGQRFSDSRYPLSEVGAHLEARSMEGGRTAFNHLLALAYANGLSRSRAAEMLEMVGLSEVGRKRVKGFSLGMVQHLGIAAALLGNPSVLLFDESMNGLDPEGIKWVRDLFRGLAAHFVTGEIMLVVSFVAGQALIGSNCSASFSTPGVISVLAECIVGLILFALLALGIGMVVPRAVGTIGTLVAVVLVVPWIELAILTGYTIVVLVVGTLLTLRRDV